MPDNSQPAGEAQSKILSFTGERYTPEIEGNIYLEHMHRYLMVRDLVTGKDVLDIASGEGFGSYTLSRFARSVVGVDIDKSSVEHALSRYKEPKLDFRSGSCSQIPLEDRSVDVVVSFETIEHHDEHERMMQEVRRVLRPGGVLIISSPEKHEYTDVPGTRNPFHVKELYRDEFQALMNAQFRNVAIYGQRVIFGSAIFLRLFCHSTSDVSSPVLSE
jgi:ubiquinone/menaquinone biosynthesis C-methylase UbiE